MYSEKIQKNIIQTLVRKIETYYPRNPDGRIPYGDILTRENILLKEMPDFKKDKAFGQYLKEGPERKPVIYIAPYLDDKEKRFICVYMLANYFLYKDSTQREKREDIFSQKDKDARAFADEFLLPQNLLNQSLKNFLTKKEISEKFKTPLNVVRHRLNTLYKSNKRNLERS